MNVACRPLLGMSLLAGDKRRSSPQPAWGTLLSDLCQIFFATWCHITRKVTSHSSAKGLGAFQVLGEHGAVTAAGALKPRGHLCLMADLSDPSTAVSGPLRPADPGQAVGLLCLIEANDTVQEAV